MATMRELGEKRIEAARQIKSREDRSRLWKPQAHPFVFKPGACWTQCTEYAVTDFASEIGFWIDILGFEVNAFGPEYAMLCPHDRKYFFSVVPAKDGRSQTPPDAIRLGFMVDGIQEIGEKLRERGIRFDEEIAPDGSPDSPLYKGTFRTPAGIAVDLWGMVEQKPHLV